MARHATAQRGGLEKRGLVYLEVSRLMPRGAGATAVPLRTAAVTSLQQALDRVDLALEQTEHEDGVRRRWAARATER